MATDSRSTKTRALSLQLKLVFSYIFVILTSFTIIGYLLDKNLEEQSLGEIKSSLSNQANLVESQIPLEKLKSGDVIFLNTLAKDLGKKINSRITIIDKSGEVLADSEMTDVSKMDNHLDRPEVKVLVSLANGVALPPVVVGAKTPVGNSAYVRRGTRACPC